MCTFHVYRICCFGSKTINNPEHFAYPRVLTHLSFVMQMDKCCGCFFYSPGRSPYLCRDIHVRSSTTHIWSVTHTKKIVDNNRKRAKSNSTRLLLMIVSQWIYIHEVHKVYFLKSSQTPLPKPQPKSPIPGNPRKSSVYYQLMSGSTIYKLSSCENRCWLFPKPLQGQLLPCIISSH